MNFQTKEFINLINVNSIFLDSYYNKYRQQIDLNEIKFDLIDNACKEKNFNSLKVLYPLKDWKVEIKDSYDFYRRKSLFCYCCKSNYVESTKFLYYTFFLKQEDLEGEPIRLACKEGNLDILKWLFLIYDNCSYIIIYYSELFKFAYENNRVEIVKWLIENQHGKSYEIQRMYYQLAILTSCMREQYDLIDILLDKNSKKEITFDNIFEQLYKKENVVKYIIEKRPDLKSNVNLKLFIEVCNDNNINFAKWIIQTNGDDILKKDITIDNLFQTINTKSNQNLEIGKFLYQINNNINFKNGDVFRKAVMNDNLEYAEWILSIEPNISILGYFFDSVCCNSTLRAAKFVLEKFPDINICDQKDKLFRNVCNSGNLEMAQWLYNINDRLNINIDFLWPFNYSCNLGHIHILKWLLEIFPNEKIPKNQFTSFINACKNNNIEVAKWLLSNSSYIPESNEEIFYSICENNLIEMAKWFYEEKPDINLTIGNNKIFKCAVKHGYFELSKFLYELNNNVLDEDESDELSAFYYICFCNNNDFIKWVLQVKPSLLEVEEEIDEIYDNFCGDDNIEIVELFSSLYPSVFTYEIDDGEIIDWEIAKIFVIKRSKNKNNLEREIDVCMICKEDNSDVVTICNHFSCQTCILEWMAKNESCPYCRRELDEETLFKIIY